ncbi:MAG: hypothetical protein PHX24_14175, partial [Acidithiobacillus sp.]|nr:hypothetical protein [Acidithiobacillus sp.]
SQGQRIKEEGNSTEKSYHADQKNGVSRRTLKETPEAAGVFCYIMRANTAGVLIMPSEISPIFAVILIAILLYVGWRILRGLLKIAFIGILVLLAVGFAVSASNSPVSTSNLVATAKQWTIAGFQTTKSAAEDLTHKR